MNPRYHSTSSRPNLHRLQYLDGLRGILCIIVVYHHFQCGFNPCHVFGPIAEWIRDPSVCKVASNSTEAIGVRGIAKEIFQVVMSPLSSGPFAVACFFVMSGCALSINLLQESASGNSCDKKWRLAVVKRFFRLALPCSMLIIFAYMLARFDFHRQGRFDLISRIGPTPSLFFWARSSNLWNRTHLWNRNITYDKQY